MRDYAKVMTRFWTDGTGREIQNDDDARLLAMYLFTNEHGSMYGLYRLALPTMQHELGKRWTVERIRSTMARLSKHDIAHWDEERDIVYLPAGAATQIAKTLKPTDNRRSAIAKALDRFRDHSFWAMFARKYCAPYHLNDDLSPRKPGDLPSPSQAPPKPLPRGFTGPTKPPARGSRSEAGAETETGERGAPPPDPSDPDNAILAQMLKWPALTEVATIEMARSHRATSFASGFRQAAIIQGIDQLGAKAAARMASGDAWSRSELAEKLVTFTRSASQRAAASPDVGSVPYHRPSTVARRTDRTASERLDFDTLPDNAVTRRLRGTKAASLGES